MSSRAAAFLVLATSAGITVPAFSADPTTLESGHKVFDYWCGTCHSAAVSFLGPNSLPGTLALKLKYKGEKPALLEERTDLSVELVKYVVRHGIQSMPSFRKTEINDAELDALAAYLARNNK